MKAKTTYYGLRIKPQKRDLYSIKSDSPEIAGLVGCSAEFLGDVVYYRFEAPQDYNWFWLVEEKNIVENALDNPTEVEDDAIWYESPLFDGPEAMQAEINADDVEIVKIDFSTDTDEYSDKCFAFLNEEKANVGEFLPLGWEAKDDDEQPTEDDTDVEINIGPKLSCPMLFWEGEAKAGGWIAADWEYEDGFKGTDLSYKVTTV